MKAFKDFKASPAFTKMLNREIISNGAAAAENAPAHDQNSDGRTRR